MNELDKRIAELKGWRPPRPWNELSEDENVNWVDASGRDTGKAIFFGYGNPEHGETEIEAFCPSESDSDALDLVDELLQSGFEFYLWAAPKGNWSARFHFGGRSSGNGFLHGAPTRPEAICRAYIAAREWMVGRKEG